jgi:predicted mannosyl-3-phosphoglycerate phosphatase (HAD superfamily)
MSEAFNKGKVWYDKNITKLLDDVKDKKSREVIAKEHGRTIGGIRSKLKGLAADYYFNKKPTDEIMKITGLTAEELADAIERRRPRDIRKQESITKYLGTENSQKDPLKELLEVAKDIQRMVKEIYLESFIEKVP